MWNDIAQALNLSGDFGVTGQENWESRFAVTDLAVNAVGAVGVALASLLEAANARPTRASVRINRRLASLWFAMSISPLGWKLTPPWDAIAGDYRARDGWIKLHTNLSHHRHAACTVLGVEPQREAVEAAVATWCKDDLEAAIHVAGGVAAAMRSRAEWLAHPQGQAVAAEPLIRWSSDGVTRSRAWSPKATRPLEGVRVLDLTRVLAGPVATRTLAGFGADVLRIDPPGWEEGNVEPDITLGKNCATLDLKSEAGRRRFETLLRETDIFVHGYRPGALDNLGFGADWRHSLAPDLIDISLDAFGWTGPWARRRGFDSLVQMSSGIADEGMKWAASDKPTPLPVQALDHATGYLMAAAAIRALEGLVRGEPAMSARLSLARSAELLARTESDRGEPISGACDEDFSPEIEQTPWGAARRLLPPVSVEGAPMFWNSPATRFGSGKLSFSRRNPPA